MMDFSSSQYCYNTYIVDVGYVIKFFLIVLCMVKIYY